MAVLVAGGAGYIGSHTALMLRRLGEEVVIADSLYKGHKDAAKGCKLMVGDLRNSDFLDEVFTTNKIDAVIDFAADSLVGESMIDPLKYYNNNVASTCNLLGKMHEHNVRKIVFSSTAATYGEPENIPIFENDRTFPTNPYGETKLAVERMLKWCDKAYGIKFVALRYFNAAGADPQGEIGEDHLPESHLIPIILQTALGQRESIGIFGDDYETKDGSCVRDYIHVNDLSEAHILALKKLKDGGKSDVFNLGNGKGFSVKEVIEEARKVTGMEIKTVIEKRRSGDPAVLIASSQKAQTHLDWKPKFNDLTTILETAWNWHKSHPNGYNDR